MLFLKEITGTTPMTNGTCGLSLSHSNNSYRLVSPSCFSGPTSSLDLRCIILFIILLSLWVHIYMGCPNILFHLSFDFIERVSYLINTLGFTFFHWLLNYSDLSPLLHMVHLILLLYNIPLVTCTVCDAHLGYFQDFTITSSASVPIVHVQEYTCEQNCWVI